MLCPKCNNNTQIYNTRHAPNNRTWRRHECLKCGYRFSTYEFIRPSMEITKGMTNLVVDRFFKGKDKFTIEEMTALKSITKFGLHAVALYYKGKL